MGDRLLHQCAQPSLQAVVGPLGVAEPVDGATVADRGVLTGFCPRPGWGAVYGLSPPVTVGAHRRQCRPPPRRGGVLERRVEHGRAARRWARRTGAVAVRWQRPAAGGGGARRAWPARG